MCILCHENLVVEGGRERENRTNCFTLRNRVRREEVEGRKEQLRMEWGT
jgi:hypothetical protein